MREERGEMKRESEGSMVREEGRSVLFPGDRVRGSGEDGHRGAEWV